MIKQIISVYASLWADVLYNRRLEIHLRKIEHDIAFVELLITIACFKRSEATSLRKIHKDLIGLRKIIRKKISSSVCLINVIVVGALIDNINN